LKLALLIIILGVPMILIGLVFSLDLSTVKMITGSQNHANEATNPSSTIKELNKDTPADPNPYSNVIEQSGQFGDDQAKESPYSHTITLNESDGQVINATSGESTPLPAPLPDGRIFPRGEPPYGYLPTCSPKDKDLPYVPVEPD
jgi:hypothetical protein